MASNVFYKLKNQTTVQQLADVFKFKQMTELVPITNAVVDSYIQLACLSIDINDDLYFCIFQPASSNSKITRAYQTEERPKFKEVHTVLSHGFIAKDMQDVWHFYQTQNTDRGGAWVGASIIDVTENVDASILLPEAIYIGTNGTAYSSYGNYDRYLDVCFSDHTGEVYKLRCNNWYNDSPSLYAGTIFGTTIQRNTQSIAELFNTVGGFSWMNGDQIVCNGAGKYNGCNNTFAALVNGTLYHIDGDAYTIGNGTIVGLNVTLFLKQIYCWKTGMVFYRTMQDVNIIYWRKSQTATPEIWYTAPQGYQILKSQQGSKLNGTEVDPAYYGVTFEAVNSDGRTSIVKGSKSSGASVLDGSDLTFTTSHILGIIGRYDTILIGSTSELTFYWTELGKTIILNNGRDETETTQSDSTHLFNASEGTLQMYCKLSGTGNRIELHIKEGDVEDVLNVTAVSYDPRRYYIVGVYYETQGPGELSPHDVFIGGQVSTSNYEEYPINESVVNMYVALSLLHPLPPDAIGGNKFELSGCDINTIDKTTYLTDRGEFKGVMRENENIDNIVMDVYIDDDNHYNWNYVYLPHPLNRYYYVTDITLINKYIQRISLKCDVLYSFASLIWSQSGIIERSNKLYDTKLADAMIHLSNETVTETVEPLAGSDSGNRFCLDVIRGSESGKFETVNYSVHTLADVDGTLSYQRTEVT